MNLTLFLCYYLKKFKIPVIIKSMKKSFEVYLYNRIEKIGNKEYNHIGCEGIDKDCGDVLSEFVPNLGDKVKVKFTIEKKE